MIVLGELEPPAFPSCPPGLLGVATVEAADLVDRAAVQLLTACAPYDPAAVRLARLQAFLAAWPAVEVAVRQLAAHVQAEGLPSPANDVDQVRASA